MSLLLNSRQALQYLGLWDPLSGHEPNHRYLKYLSERELLPRMILGHKTIRYERDSLDYVLNLVKKTGIRLTDKPVKNNN